MLVIVLAPNGTLSDSNIISEIVERKKMKHEILEYGYVV
jgi:hypothetical protein